MITIDTHYGEAEVTIRGDISNDPVILTVHDIGLNRKFSSSPVRARVCVCVYACVCVCVCGWWSCVSGCGCVGGGGVKMCAEAIKLTFVINLLIKGNPLPV